MSLEADVLQRIKREYPGEQLATVTALLEGCGSDYRGNRGEIQRAILKLADGDLELLQHNVQASKTDFRDVLYWAFGWDDDPRRLLWELRDELVGDGVMSSQDDTSLGLVGTHQGLGAELRRLCKMLQQRQNAVSAAQLATIKKLVRRLRLPARTWKSLATRPG